LRSYLRFDPEFADRKAHYPDGAIATFALTLSFAEQQPQRGFFKKAVLKALLERRSRWIPFLIEHGDLEVLPDGRLYFVGWIEWNEGDWKVSERVQRIRTGRDQRKKSVTPVTPPTVTPTVSTPSEHIAVGGRRYAVSISGDALQDDDGLKLGVLMEPLVGHALSAIDIENCRRALSEFRHLAGVEHLVKRAGEHKAYCIGKNLPVPRSVQGYMDSWRRENDHMADTKAPTPRPYVEMAG
jgi:hypothetical protein